MINREDWHMIKQMHERGCYQKDIAETLGVSARTVSRALKRQGAPAKRRHGIRSSKLDAFKPLIDELLAAEVWNAEVIYAEIKTRGYRGGRTLVRQYVAPKRRLRASKATVRFETDPGRQLQHDWGELMTQVGGEWMKVYFAVNTLGYSRRFHVWAAFSLDAAHTYESLIRSFEYFGGVTDQVLVDNQKAAVIAHKAGGQVRFNAGFLALASHYGFQPRACRPARAQTKGKDERNVGYVKHNFFQRYRAFEDLAHLNQCLERWLGEVADPRCHGTVKEVVSERFAREAPHLKALPAIRFDTSVRETRQVAWDGYIDVRGNRYSVPSAYCGRTVAVRITLDGELKVYADTDKLIAEHRLVPPAAGWQTVSTHHERLWRETLQVETRDLRVYEEVGQWS